MTPLQALVLGIVQGLTEFLPISSSAHLVLVPYFFQWELPEEQVFSFDVLVQIGTLVAVIIYFRRDLISVTRSFLEGLITRKPFEDKDSRLGWYLIIATIPAGLAGLFLDDLVEDAFNNPMVTAYFLFGTAALMLLGEWLGKRSRSLDEMKWLDALLIGITQALAIFPGISRSGSTISAGLMRKFKRQDSGRFSFLMAVPIMLAAGLLSLIDLLNMPDLGGFLPVLAIGFITSAVVGYLSIHWLLQYLNRNSLRSFAVYCILLGTVALLFQLIR